MDKLELLEAHKKNILNFGIIIIALFIVFQIYRSADEKVNKLSANKTMELKMNSVSGEIASLETKVDMYKQIFAKKDMSSVVEAISNIAKNNSVNILSVRPAGEEEKDDYIKSAFTISTTCPSYDALGSFISQIEAAKDIYTVETVAVKSDPSNNISQDAKMNLNVDLRVSTISYK